MISMFQFIALYEGYYYKCHCFYIFTIHFLFLSSQSYSLLFILSINHYCFLSICLFVVTISIFVFVGRCYWYICACLNSGSVSLSPYSMVAIGAFVLVCYCLCYVSRYS